MKIVTFGKNISILIGLLYVLFILYNRLIRERLPRNILLDYNNLILLSYFLLFFTSLFIIIFYIREILKIKAKFRILNKLIEIPIMEKIFRLGADMVINYILKGPKNLYEFLYKRIKIRPIIDIICKKICDWDLNENIIFLYFILIYKYIFIFTIAVIFSIEVFYFSYFKYFYKSLLYLLIPLLIDLFLFIIYNLADKNKNVIEEWINFPVNEKGDGFNMRLNIENKDNPLLQINGDEKILLETIHFHYTTWYRYLYSKMTIDNFYTIEKKYKPFMYIIIYSIYGIGWGYILYRIYLNEYGSLLVDAFQLLWTIEDIEEPFSLNNINHEHP
jgi:hypothetical protein